MEIINEELDLSWIREQRLMVTSKVAFFNSCNFLKKMGFTLLHGRNFRPSENEKRIFYYFKNENHNTTERR